MFDIKCYSCSCYNVLECVVKVDCSMKSAPVFVFPNLKVTNLFVVAVFRMGKSK